MIIDEPMWVEVAWFAVPFILGTGWLTFIDVYLIDRILRGKNTGEVKPGGEGIE